MVNVILFIFSWIVVFGLIFMGSNLGLMTPIGMGLLVVLGIILSVMSLNYGQKTSDDEEKDEEE